MKRNQVENPIEIIIGCVGTCFLSSLAQPLFGHDFKLNFYYNPQSTFYIVTQCVLTYAYIQLKNIS
jgi:hypothetical protein